MTHTDYEVQAREFGWYFCPFIKKWTHPDFPHAGYTKARYAVEDHANWLKWLFNSRRTSR